ncbi:MAG: enoyl-CoA hydratase/isomerase family protein [Actinomycetota bacterium]|jgi:enoyl-CoA hydratase/carnithine racemase|nr:enoyl-CoA hydratase/isomerase family protein [Actinomycetota bacterium]
MTERVRLEFDDRGVATITLDHPPLNVYDLEMRDQLIEAVTAVRDVPSTRCLLLRAAGRHFSAGADLSEFGSATSIFEARRIRWDRDPWVTLSELPVPTVAELHGYTIGSGLEMSLLCDLRIAADDTVVGLPETKLAMLPAAGGTQSLTRALGPHAASPIVLTGRNLDAAEALQRGVIHEVVPVEELQAVTRERTSALALLDPGVVRSLKRCFAAAHDLPLEQGLTVERSLAGAERTGE